MTLNDLERLFDVKIRPTLCCSIDASFGAHCTNWMKIDPYYQRQKCRRMNLVSENIRFMRIFAGVPLSRGVKPHWGLSTTAIFGNFENFTDTAGNNMWGYAAPYRPANDCKMNDLECCYFMTKCVFGPALLESERLKLWMSEIVQPLRFCGVLCIARSVSQPR